MVFKFIIIGLLCAQAVFVSVNAQTIEPISANSLGALPQIRSVKISPGGDKILMLKNIDGEIKLITRVLSAPPSNEHIISAQKGDFNWAEWTSNDHFLASYRYINGKGGGDKRTVRLERRLQSMTWDGKNIINPVRSTNNRGFFDQVFIEQPQIQDTVIDMLKDDPDHILLQLDKENDKKFAVYKVNIHTKKRVRILRSKRNVDWWITDHNHVIRYGEGVMNLYRGEKIRRRAFYRTSENDDWIQLFEYDEVTQERPFYFAGFTESPNVIYVKSNDSETGKLSLFTYDIEKTKILKKISGYLNFDIDSVFTDDDGKLEFHTYYDERPKYSHYQEDGIALIKEIEDQFPSMAYSIINKSKDKRKVIVYVTAPQNPGSFYLYDIDEDNWTLLGEKFPAVNTEYLSEMKEITYTARDGLKITGYLSRPAGSEGKRLPMIIMPHGGPQSRDTWRFDYWTQFLTSRGYGVLQMNFRGSLGYGEEFRDLGYREWGGKMLDDINDATKWAIKNEFADPNRICIAGASYGGYAALQGVVKDGSLYKCSISFAPVTDLTTFMVSLEDAVGYQSYVDYVKSEELSYDEASPAQNLDRLNIPVLLMHGTDDANVPVVQSRDFYKKMKDARKNITYIEFEKGDHSLSDQKYRIQFLKEIEIFLEKYL